MTREDKYKTKIELNKLLELLQKANQLPLTKGRGLLNEQ